MLEWDAVTCHSGLPWACCQETDTRAAGGIFPRAAEALAVEVDLEDSREAEVALSEEAEQAGAGKSVS